MKLWLSVVAVFALAAISSGASAAAAFGAQPTIVNESVSNLTPTDATLEAEINPQSTERGVWYQFQVAAAPGEFAPEFTCPTEGFPAHSSLCLGIPSQAGALPISWLPSGTEAEQVSIDLASEGMELQPGVTYYWRVIAAGAVQTIDTIDWEKPAVHGAGMSFETPPPGFAPTIESESVSAVTETEATLEAVIDSGGLPTEYEFRLWERWKCELGGCEPPIHLIPLPGGELPGSASPQSVSLDLNSAGVYLHSPLNFYEYWVTATNSAGSIEGPIQTFAPLEEEPGATEPPLPGGSSDAPQDQGTGLIPPPPAGTSGQGPPKATLCRRASHRHRARHERHHRAGIRKGCRLGLASRPAG